MVPLYIILHGLIALVPLNEADGVNHMTALLVDATTRPAEMVDCFVKHSPMLSMTVEDPKECLAAGCAIPATQCVCDFAMMPHKQAVVDIQPSVDFDKQEWLDAKPQNDLPFDPAAAGSFSNLANLTLPPLNATLNKAALSQGTPTAPIPGALLARMTFPFETVTACTLAVRRAEGSNLVHPLGFRPIHTDEKAEDLTQALAQQAVAYLKVPDNGNVTVTISDFDGGNQKSIKLATEVNSTTGGVEYMLMLENSRTDLRPDDACDDGVGRDFAFFYGLTENPLPWAKRPIPHVKYNRWKSASEITVDICQKHPTLAMTSRPICAMASFNSPPPSE